MKSKGFWLSLFLILMVQLISSCSKTKSKPELLYTPNMTITPALKTQELDPHDLNYRANRIPVPGTVPRDYEPYPYATADTVGPAKKLVNPLLPTLTILQTGRKYYNTYCIVCHGAKGEGNGYIVPKFPAPPSLLTEKIAHWEDGRIYHMITKGRGNMPSYSLQLEPSQRWAVVHYVRVLYRAAHPTLPDLEEMQRLKLDFSEDEPDTSSVSRWPKK